MLARQVRRALGLRDFASAAESIDRMLAAYPNAALAYTFAGQLAREEGREADAQRAFQTAAALVREHRDTYYEKRPVFQGIQ